MFVVRINFLGVKNILELPIPLKNLGVFCFTAITDTCNAILIVRLCLQVFELLTLFCQVDGVRLVVCKSMVASFPLQDQSQFQNLVHTPLSRLADPLLATLHWAGQSTDTHGLGT